MCFVKIFSEKYDETCKIQTFPVVFQTFQHKTINDFETIYFHRLNFSVKMVGIYEQKSIYT